MNKVLKNILCCPHCKGDLSFFDESSIECLNCQTKFEVIQNIPIMFTPKGILSSQLMKDYLDCYQKIARDDIEKTIENISTKNRRHLKLKEFIGQTRNKIILDIGAGQGLFLRKLEGYRIAFDIAVDYLKIAQKNGLISVVGLAEELPFKNQVLDIVICADILEHVLSPEKVVEEVFRVLKPGGSFFIEVPYKEDLSVYKKYEGVYKFTHLRSFDVGSLRKLLKNFTIVKQKFSMHKSPNWPFKMGGIFKYFPERLNSLFLDPLFIQMEAKKRKDPH